MQRHRFVHRQLKFLLAVRDESTSLKQITDDLRMKPALLSRWLRRPHFRQALAEAKRERRRRQRLELDLAEGQATHTLATMVAGGGGSHLARQASYDVLELSSREKQVRAKAKGATRKSAAGSPIHPSVTPEQAAEHIRVLSQKPDPKRDLK